MVPGGSTRIGSMVAAYALVRECYSRGEFSPNEETLLEELAQLESMSESSVEQLREDVKIFEDAPANTTGDVVQTNTPTKKMVKSPLTRFTVSKETLDRFPQGKSKGNLSKQLNLDDDTDKELLRYTKTNPKDLVLLQDVKGNAKALSYSKKKPTGKARQYVESYLDDMDIEVIDLV